MNSNRELGINCRHNVRINPTDSIARVMPPPRLRHSMETGSGEDSYWQLR